MADSPVQQIKDKLDIVELVRSYVKLEKTGINWRAPCPFHSEKKPSFFVSPARQMFKCFGCNESGSVFDFIMKIEGVEFGDALRLLAKRAGVELKTSRPELRTKRQRLYEICELSCRFFEKQLQGSSRGKEVKDYLLKRGIKQATIKKWRLGYSPEKWRTLSDFLVSRGFKREEVLEAGLAVKSEKSRLPYDRFRGRIVFPVFDLNSQVIGFGGRVFSASQRTAQRKSASGDEQEVIAKYINIPNTLLYDKSRVIYGLNFAKMEIRKKDSCILTEGYTDVILSHQAGFENTVASSGTALTPYQLKILKRYTSNLLTAFDMDVAGDLATKRGIDLAQREDFEVQVICMPKDTDPADIVLKSPKKWASLVEKAKEIMEFYFENACSKFDKGTPKGKREIANVFLPAIKRVPNKILQSHWAQKLAGALKVSEEAILEELRKSTKKEPVPALASSVSSSAGDISLKKQEQKSRLELLEERMLSLVFHAPSCLSFIDECVFADCSSGVGEILRVLSKEKAQNREKIDEAAVAKLKKKSDGLKTIIDNCFFNVEVEQCAKPEEEIKICSASWVKIFNQNKLQTLSKDIQLAEEKGDEKKLKDLMKKFQELSQNCKV